MTRIDALAHPVAVGLIGAGGIGAYHGESLADRVPETRLVAIADPSQAAAARLAETTGCDAIYDDGASVLADDRVEAVLIAAPPQFHADLVVAASKAGKAVFCEKPMAVTLDDARRAVEAAADVPLQIGFNRRFDAGFRAAHDQVVGGRIGTPQLLRSLTRDPGIPDPAAVRPSTIFLETLIHDFDALRYLNPGAETVDVYAVAGALAYPEFAEQGLQDTAVVMIRFDNGAIATAEASFHAAYGYDVRGEAFGPGGMVTAGDQRRTTATYFGPEGVVNDSWQRNVDLFHDAYVAQLRAFAHCVRDGSTPEVSGGDAVAALSIALAAVRSAGEGRPVRIDEVTR